MINFMFVFMCLLFLLVFISDYKTWIGSFMEPFRIRKIRKEYNKKSKYNN